jgi:hypothetical protein
MDCRHIIALIDAVDGTAAAIATVAGSASTSAANDLVHARRTLSTQAIELSRAIEDGVVSQLGDHPSRAAVELRRDYLDRSNRARSVVADHQGKWPAVAMRDAIGQYRIDVKRLHADQQAYRAWLKNEFVPRSARLLEQ